jgi:hypothetical protein
MALANIRQVLDCANPLALLPTLIAFDAENLQPLPRKFLIFNSTTHAHTRRP